MSLSMRYVMISSISNHRNSSSKTAPSSLDCCMMSARVFVGSSMTMTLSSSTKDVMYFASAVLTSDPV